MLRRRSRQAGLPDLHPHQFRHTFATLASARQVGLAHPRGIPERSAGGARRGPGRPAPDASHHPPFRPDGREPAPER